MTLVPFELLPNAARLWIFPADRPLEGPVGAGLLAGLDAGLGDWNAHGSPVTWGRTLVEDQILLIGIDESRTALSGCSIDACTRRIKELEQVFEVSFLDGSRVFYRRDGAWVWASRPDFRALAEAGTVTGATRVLQNVLETVGDFRVWGLEAPARDGWHAEAFPLKGEDALPVSGGTAR